MFKAIGAILLLIAFRLMMPDVFHGLEATLLQVLVALQTILTKGQMSMPATPSVKFGI